MSLLWEKVWNSILKYVFYRLTITYIKIQSEQRYIDLTGSRQSCDWPDGQCVPEFRGSQNLLLHQNPWVLSLTQRCHVNLFVQTPTWQTITVQTGLLNHSMSYFNTDAVCFSELRNSSGLFGNVSIGGAKTEKGHVCSSSFISKFLSIA